MRRYTTFVLCVMSLLSCADDPTADVPRVTPPVPPGILEQDDALDMRVVRLTPQQAVDLRIVTSVVEKNLFSYKLTLPGTVFPAPDRIFMVSAPISGRITSLYAHEGEQVERGQPLVELESLEFANLVAEYLQAQAEVGYQKSQHERVAVLVEKKISPRRTLEKVGADFVRAKAALQAAQARLSAVGVTEGRLSSLTTEKAHQARLTMYAPISGRISEHLIDLGQSVNGYERMATLVNLEKVLIKGYASPDDAGLIRPGDGVAISLKSFPGRKIQGKVAAVNPSLDPVNRSIPVISIVHTQDGWPMPGINIRMDIQVQTPEPVITVPLSALGNEGDRAMVFLKTGENSYQKHAVTIHRITSRDVIVDSGLQGGEEIAISQVFTLKALGKIDEAVE